MTTFPPATNHLCEVLPAHWYNAEVSFSTKSRLEIIDEEGNRYLHEPMRVTALKCAALFFFGIPLYFIGYTATRLIRATVTPILHASFSLFLKEVWKIVRIPFYFIALEFSAFYGIFKPLEGRAWYGHFEKQFHFQADRRGLCQHKPKDMDAIKLIKDAILLENPAPFVTAICMWSYGKTTDSYIKNVQILQAV